MTALGVCGYERPIVALKFLFKKAKLRLKSELGTEVLLPQLLHTYLQWAPTISILSRMLSFLAGDFNFELPFVQWLRPSQIT